MAGDDKHSGRATVPCLWDRKTRTVVSNESSEILRMFTREWGSRELLPEALESAIDELNEWIYPTVNNGVYSVGFARSQAAYEEALQRLFVSLDRIDTLLGKQRFLCGSQLTEADIRLFPTLIRFDAVYHSHFKCSLQRIAEYENLGPYLRDLYQHPEFRSTVRLDFYKLGYMGRSERLNPSRIISRSPRNDLDAPHHRERLDP